MLSYIILTRMNKITKFCRIFKIPYFSFYENNLIIEKIKIKSKILVFH